MNVSPISLTNTQSALAQSDSAKNQNRPYVSAIKNSTDSFSKSKLDSTSFKGTGSTILHITEATAGTGVAAATSAGIIVAAPVVIPILVVGGIFVALHGIFHMADD